MPSLPSQSLFQEREEVVQLWRGGGDRTRTADKEIRVPFKNQAENTRCLETGIINHHSHLSNSESDVMTRKAARVQEATHVTPTPKPGLLLTEPPDGDTYEAMNRRQEACKPTPIKIPS